MGDEPEYFCGCIDAMAVSRTDFDQLQRDHDALRAQFDQHRVDTGQDAHRLISEKMAALDKYDALLEQVRAAREARVPWVKTADRLPQDADQSPQGYVWCWLAQPHESFWTQRKAKFVRDFPHVYPYWFEARSPYQAIDAAGEGAS